MQELTPFLSFGFVQDRRQIIWNLTPDRAISSSLPSLRSNSHTSPEAGPLSASLATRQLMLFTFNILKTKPCSPLALTPLAQVFLTAAWFPAWINKRNPFFLFYKASLQPLFPLPWEVSIMIARANKKPEAENGTHITGAIPRIIRHWSGPFTLYHWCSPQSFKVSLPVDL